MDDGRPYPPPAAERVEEDDEELGVVQHGWHRVLIVFLIGFLVLIGLTVWTDIQARQWQDEARTVRRQLHHADEQLDHAQQQLSLAQQVAGCRAVIATHQVTALSQYVQAFGTLVALQAAGSDQAALDAAVAAMQPAYDDLALANLERTHQDETCGN